MSIPTIGVNEFFNNHCQKDKGNSYTKIGNDDLIRLARYYWDVRVAGEGEVNLERKVLVPIPKQAFHGFVSPDQSAFFCPPRVKLVKGMPVRAQVTVRQEGEEPHVETFITPEDAKNYDLIEVPANKVSLVVYSADALLENDGKRSTECDWEIVVVLCSEGNDQERMTPLTMARNQLEKAGGTKPAVPYTSEEWATAVWAHSTNRGIKVRKA